MEIKTQEFREVASKILFAADLDKESACLEILANGPTLRLSVATQEYFVAVSFPLSKEDNFRAVVDASLFLNLISKITAETFNLSVKENVVIIKHGRSSYKAPMIYKNDKLVDIKPIIVNNKTVTMNIDNEILNSILNVNSKELLKVKNLNVNELQRQYYIDENGCFTFSTGACLNSFKLEKPVKLLLTDKIVKLFKLFDEPVSFCYGVDQGANNTAYTKVSFETNNIYLAAIINGDYAQLSKIQGPCQATKNYIDEHYANHLVLSATELSAAISRLMMFIKDSNSQQDTKYIPATISFTDSEFTIQDNFENSEVVSIVQGSYIDPTPYTLAINLSDLKLVLDACKSEYITLNCGNHKSVVITRGSISNLIPEVRIR